MAIQLRRGPYNQFDPSKLVSGEGAVVLEGDPNVEDGKALYVSFDAGSAKRMATFEDMDDIKTEFIKQVGSAVTKAEQFVSTATSQEASRVQAEANREIAETSRDSAEQIREFNEQQRMARETVRVEAESDRISAESSRVSAEASRVIAETGRVTEFEEMRQAFQGMQCAIVPEGSYDPETGTPTIDGNPSLIYYVPNPKQTVGDLYLEWRYLLLPDDTYSWELIGGRDKLPDVITTEDMDAVLDDGQVPEANRFLSLYGLKYFWVKLKAKFAAKVHKHSASDITSGTLPSARIADNSISADKIMEDAITAAKIAASAIVTEALADGAVTDTKLSQSLRDSLSQTPRFGSEKQTSGEFYAWEDFSVGSETMRVGFHTVQGMLIYTRQGTGEWVSRFPK